MYGISGHSTRSLTLIPSVYAADNFTRAQSDAVDVLDRYRTKKLNAVT